MVSLSLGRKQRRRREKPAIEEYSWSTCMAPHTPFTEAIEVQWALQMAYREPGTYIHGCHAAAETYIYMCNAFAASSSSSSSSSSIANIGLVNKWMEERKGEGVYVLSENHGPL
ncbi:hypothetical protein V6N11_052671 [Hibiscus sabdariffa]|uniref:Uncharacterized protein n=1 Tax=Hibiscus sabdariffa TaxID=183260 RepID=A0ABR2UB21_9ROSI